MSYEYIKCGPNKWRACYTEYVCPDCGRPTLFSYTAAVRQDAPRRLQCWECGWRGAWGRGMQGAIDAAKEPLAEALAKAIAEAL